MLAAYWNDLFTDVVQSLPMLFVSGVPVLLVLVTLAAAIDVKLPHADRMQ